jgi:predicted small secreted protein
MRNQSLHRSFSRGAPALRRQKKKGQIMVRKTLEYVAIGGLLLLAACNTVAGAGKDVSSVGKTVTNTANDAK